MQAEEMVRPGMHTVIIFWYTSNPQSIYLCSFLGTRLRIQAHKEGKYFNSFGPWGEATCVQ